MSNLMKHWENQMQSTFGKTGPLVAEIISVIKYQKPPHYKLIKWMFPAYDFKTTVMTWGGLIYTSTPLPEQTIAHEWVHVKQQRGRNKWIFLFRFWLSAKFRLKMELEAYQEEWRIIKQKYSGSMHYDYRQSFLNRMAEHLASPLYKNLVSLKKAKSLIIGQEDLI